MNLMEYYETFKKVTVSCGGLLIAFVNKRGQVVVFYI